MPRTLRPLLHHPLFAYNTFGLQVQAQWFAHYTSVPQLHQALHFHHTTCPHLPLLHIGAGSNMLFLADYPGLVLHSGIQGVEVCSDDGQTVVIGVGAGMEWDSLVALCVERGWCGAENLSAIPGQVGAAAVQNIGAYGAEVAQLIEQVECVDLAHGTAHTLSASECQYAYRHSIFKGELRGRMAVVRVVLRLRHRFSPNLSYQGLARHFDERGIAPGSLTARHIREAVMEIRAQKLPSPSQLGNAGSFFMNPVISLSHYQSLQAEHPTLPCYPLPGGHEVKVPAAWLIEHSGWKGRSLGPAAVHRGQPLVLVNTGGATGADILRLCQAIQHDVEKHFGIRLEPEVMIIG